MNYRSVPELTDAQLERFWSKVNRSAGPDGCWPWTACLGRHGYGSLSIRIQGRNHSLLAHRVALSTVVDGNGLAIHSCDNRQCCNPLHLRWGTHVDNSKDCQARDRMGLRRRKLTPVDVVAIKSRYRAGLGAALGREFGVSNQTIWAIVRGLAWRHVTAEARSVP